MKRMVACALMLCAVTGNAYARKCFDDRITQVHVGSIIGSYGSDDGNAIFFHTSSGTLYPIDVAYNMDNSEGPGMYNLLMLSAIGGYRIAGHDTRVGDCAAIDQLNLLK